MEENPDFPFPFEPYEVQHAFMNKLYSVLKNKEIGIFESPTGTGKSLSIICGALKWLKDHQAQHKRELETIISEKCNDSSDDWFNSFAVKREKSIQLQDAKEELKLITEYELKIEKLKTIKKDRTGFMVSNETSNIKRRKHSGSPDDAVEEDFLVEDRESDSEADDDLNEKKHVLKIYYASRTHSQLAQFLGEVKRSPYKDQITVTTLGSRANFCINESVSRLKNIALVNEHCLDLQRKNNKKSCTFLKNIPEMGDGILSSVKDIEEIVQMGRQLKCCPYYATRRVIPDSELVLLPYNVLLHKPTRDAYGICLRNNILIIDEAHNLIEALNGMYSSEINGKVLQQSYWQVESYFHTYKSRFSQENLRFIKLLFHVLQKFDEKMKLLSSDSPSKIISVYEFIDFIGIGNVNIFELIKYAENSLISQKLHGFTASKVAKGITPADDRNRMTASVSSKSGTSSFLTQIKERRKDTAKPKPLEEVEPDKTQYKPSAIFAFLEFLKTLTSPTTDGRILINASNSTQQTSLKFLHLNPAAHFQDIVADARSIILAGGTMQPVSEFTEQLLLRAGVSSEKISLFSCDHVIPPANLLAIALESGPCGNTLDFTFKSRHLPSTIKELGSILLNVSNVVRGGVVCFFPSYDYEDFVFKELMQCKLLPSIEKRYKVFREPKLSSDVEKVLGEYAKCVTSSCSSGALLFSIVGGKMSEGINFSDDLGRCVIMVGLPYPNKFSVELKEKMTYLNQQSFSTKNAGDVYYNNLCMKAVNQSIGRAIRHSNDYASIILLDYRYKNSSVKDLLPGWIQKSLSFHMKFGPAYVALRKFYASKNS